MPAADLGLPDAAWRGLALRFNTQPADYLHSSWFERLPDGEMVRRLSAHPRAAPAVSAHLLRIRGLERAYCTDFSCRWARLALLDGDLLARLFRRLALAVHAEALKRELRGERSRMLQASLDTGDWHFLTRQAPLLGHARPAPATDALPTASWPLDFARVGLARCAAGFAAWGWPLTGRLALKLPADWTADLPWDPDRPAALAPDRPTFPPLLSKLIKDRAPTWHSLFA